MEIEWRWKDLHKIYLKNINKKKVFEVYKCFGGFWPRDSMHFPPKQEVWKWFSHKNIFNTRCIFFTNVQIESKSFCLCFLHRPIEISSSRYKKLAWNRFVGMRNTNPFFCPTKRTYLINNFLSKSLEVFFWYHQTNKKSLSSKLQYNNPRNILLRELLFL